MYTTIGLQPRTGEDEEGSILHMSYEEYLEWADEDVH